MTITAYIKPTNFCSIDCEHCYLSSDVRANKTVMSSFVLASTIDLIKQLSLRQMDSDIHIVWHGGEPMMLKPDWYLSAIEVIDSILGRDGYSQSIQTSLLPYSESWNDLIISRFGGYIGSSIDFSQRKVKSSPLTYIEAWMKKVNLARNSGILVIPGMVPTKMQIGKGGDIVKWFYDNGFDGFNIERYSHYGESSFYIPTNLEHSSFLIEVFDEVVRMLELGLSAPRINIVSAAINGVLNGLPGDRWGTTCQRDFIVIEPDGSLNSCPDRTSHESSFSNAVDGVNDFIASDRRRNWLRIQATSHKKDHCAVCEYRTWCKSGCPITKNGPSDGEYECSGYKTYLNHVKDILQNDYKKTLLINYAGI